MVDIAFTPALGEAIHVPISDCCDELDTVAIRFTASLGDQEYRQALEGTIKVQLWSDIASPDVQGWRAYDFNVLATRSNDSTSTKTILHLGNSAGEVSSYHEDMTQRQLEAWVPISVRSARNFSFTYRLLYPSGDIRWLGSYGHNGYAVVVCDGLRGLNLAKGWSEAGRVFTLNSPTAPVPIAEFSSIADYDMWAFPRDSYSQNSAAGDAELLIAIPRNFGLYTRKPSYVIHASPGAVMHVDLAGALMAYGTGSIMVHACYDLSRLQSLLHLRPLESGGRVELRMLHKRHAEYLMISSRNTQAPVKIVLIPVGQAEETEVDVGLDTLTELLGQQDVSQVSQVAIVARKSSDVRFFHGPFEGQTTTFIVPKHGGEFTLSPTYDFAPSSGGKESVCKVSFLTPHRSVTHGLEGIVTLPTPPPSPQIQTRKSQVSFAPAEEIIPPTSVLEESPQQLWRTSSRAITPSNSSDSTTSLDDDVARQTFIFSYLFICFRYLVAFVKLLLGLSTLRARPMAIMDIPEKQLLQDYPSEEEEGDSGHETENLTFESGSVSEEDASVAEVASDDAPASSATISEIHSPKPSVPTSPSNAAVRTLYADLLIPSPSPFPSSEQAGYVASIILAIAASSINTSTDDGMVPISSLHKVLTVNGDVPQGLEVTKIAYGDKDVASAHYLVRFLVPDARKEPGVKIRIAQTV